MDRIINCAHRGASGRAPENTIAALDMAVRLGATMAEIDIQQTADNELAVFHDDELQRTSNGVGPLWKQTLPQLKLLDAGSWFAEEFAGEKIPILAEVVATARGRLKLNIELKLHGHERDLAPLVARHLQKLDCLDFCVVTSFDHALINEVAAILPQLKTGYIIDRMGWHDSLLESLVSVLSMDKTLVTPERIRRIQAAGKEVHIWTVNEVAEMKNLQQLGVDALISNFPDRVAGVFLTDDPTKTR